MPKKAAPKAKPEREPGEGGSHWLAGVVADSIGAEYVKTGDQELDSDISDYISTRSSLLNYAIGRPGIPVGRLTTVFGLEGSFKSTLGQHLLAETQSRGGLTLLIDSEESLDKERSARFGLDPAKLVVISGATLNKALTAIEDAVGAMHKQFPDQLFLIVYDSLAGSATEAAMEKEIGSANYGSKAKVVSAGLERVIPAIAKARASLVIINQLRTHINDDPRGKTARKVMGQRFAMVAENPLVFYSSLMLFTSQVGRYPDNQEPEGIEVRVDVKKCKIAPSEGRSVELRVHYLNGVDDVDGKLELLLRLGIVKSAGAWYAIEGEEKKFQRSTWGNVLAAHPELNQLIKEAPELWRS